MADMTVRELVKILSELPEEEQNKTVAMCIEGVFEPIAEVVHSDDRMYVWFFGKDYLS